MNLTLHNPSSEAFVLDFPEVIEEYLLHDAYYTTCVAFNRRGTLLAAGCMNGSILIWDFDTRGVAKELKTEGEPAGVSSVAWSKDGRRLVSATTKKISVWDVAGGNRISTHECEYTILRVSIHPRESTMCLVGPQQGPPLLLEGFGGGTQEEKVEGGGLEMNPEGGGVQGGAPGGVKCHPLVEETAVPIQGGLSKGKGGEGVSVSFGAAAFNKRGDLVFVGTARGEVLVVETGTRKVLGKMHIQGSQLVRQIVVSRNGQYMMTNSSDRNLRIFKIEIPVENAAQFAAQQGAALETEASQAGAPPKKKTTNPFFTYICDHKDPINNVPWQTACFSGDTEYVMGASGQHGEHKLILWGTTYPQILRTLDGPKEGVRDMAWHPTRPIVASVGTTGVIYLWAKEYQENWSAFAPDFKELPENEEYDEREDEFDQNPREDELPKGQKDVEDEVEIDIETVEKVGAYSDSDEDGLYFLPVEPEPDPPETEANLTPLEGDGAARTVEAPGPSSVPGETNLDIDGSTGRRKRKQPKLYEDVGFGTGGPPKSKKGVGRGGGGAKAGYVGNGKKMGRGSKGKGKKSSLGMITSWGDDVGTGLPEQGGGGLEGGTGSAAERY